MTSMGIYSKGAGVKLALTITAIIALAIVAPPFLPAQTGNVGGQIPFSGTPSGSCGSSDMAVNTATGAQYNCLSGSWNLISTGGSNSFSALTTGTNTQPATMTVGTGSSITFTSSGIVNANEANGGTFPASATVIGTNSSSQPVAVTVNGTDSKVQSGTGTFSTSNIACGDSNGGVTPCGALPTGTTATTVSSFDNGNHVATTQYVDLQTKPVYSNATTGLTLSGTTGVLTGVTGTGCTSGVCTMTTPSADGTYRAVAELITTTAGVACTAGTVQVQVGWTDADSGITYIPQALTFATVNNNSLNTINLSPANTAVGSGTAWVGYPREFRAKASNVIKYQVNQTAGEAGCTTTPIVAVRIALYGPLGY